MKRLQHILIPNSEGDTFEAIAFVGTGLAIYREYNALWQRDEYYLIHIASGSRLLGEFVTSLVHACMWLKTIKDLIDWTQPEDSFKPKLDLAKKVKLARLGIPAEEWGHMKTVYNYQEIGMLIDQGKQVVFTCHTEARVTAIQKSPVSDTITATITLPIGEYVIAVMECEYPSIVSLLDTFDINELSEIWEVLDREEHAERD